MIENNVQEGGFGNRAPLTEEQKLNGLTKLNWVAQQWPERGLKKLTEILGKNPKGLLPLFIKVAVESGPPIEEVAAEWLKENPDRELAQIVLDQAPDSSLVLKDLRKVAADIMSAE